MLSTCCTCILIDYSVLSFSFLIELPLPTITPTGLDTPSPTNLSEEGEEEDDVKMKDTVALQTVNNVLAAGPNTAEV